MCRDASVASRSAVKTCDVLKPFPGRHAVTEGAMREDFGQVSVLKRFSASLRKNERREGDRT